MTVFHGSNIDFDKVSLDFAKDRRDFGKGFYTTTIREQAVLWAQDLCLRYKTEKAFLYEFEFSKINLNGKVFDGISEEWLNFIINNRIQGGIQHNYDVVQGPVANDRIYPTITLFLNGRYDVEYTLKKLAFFKPNNQLSIHSPNALSNLVLKEKTSWKL
ncbi:hypothetical protein FACS1894110_14530 [Spirochaetia bacterium]|nr:hypothetical protein FACS1894110_14530 [Spirochaetia bacterium]